MDKDTSPITSFRDEYKFLSNFYPCVMPEGCPTAEHYYQSRKTFNGIWIEKIKKASTPGKAKRLGRQAPLKINWINYRLDVMKSTVYIKFLDNPELRSKLLQTGDRKLIESNNWGDTFWGVCNGTGENHLGRILMWVRQELRERGYSED